MPDPVTLPVLLKALRLPAFARHLRIPVKWIALSGDVDRVPWRSALGW